MYGASLQVVRSTMPKRFTKKNNHWPHREWIATTCIWEHNYLSGFNTVWYMHRAKGYKNIHQCRLGQINCVVVVVVISGHFVLRNVPEVIWSALWPRCFLVRVCICIIVKFRPYMLIKRLTMTVTCLGTSYSTQLFHLACARLVRTGTKVTLKSLDGLRGQGKVKMT